MTVTTSAPSGGGEAAVPPEDLVSLTIDGIEISVPKGTLVIRAAELLGIEIPRFCDHPLLDPAGACRQCIVEVEGQRKPMASCTITCTDGMVVKSQLTSPVAEKAQRGVMELLLINHPLDCPVCDKGGECPLQNQAMQRRRRRHPLRGQEAHVREARADLHAGAARPRAVRAVRPLHPLLQPDRGRPDDRADRARRAPAGRHRRGRPVRVVLLREHHPDLPGRRADLGGVPLPLPPLRPGLVALGVRALRGRLRDPHRPPARQGHAAAGGRTTPRSTRSGSATRGGSASATRSSATGCSTPLVRSAESGELEPASWPEALEAAARGLRPPRGRAGVLTGGRLTVEDAYAYAKFARVALDTNDIDFRARVHSGEEADFLAARVAGRGRDLDGSGRHVHRAGEGTRPSCSPDSSPRRRRPASSCGCARPTARHGQRTFSPGHPRHPRPGEGGRHAAAGRSRHRDRVAGRARVRRRPGGRRARRPPRRCAPRAR